MLPRAVADELRQGHSIPAEQYPGCTIFFCDIVGFTKLSGSSTPFEVVALLNKLYICFDFIIDTYDVYKVETIGDACMLLFTAFWILTFTPICIRQQFLPLFLLFSCLFLYLYNITTIFALMVLLVTLLVAKVTNLYDRLL